MSEQSTEISGFIVLLYGKVSAIFQNELGLDSCLTLFELIGQDVSKTIADMKIKSDGEQPALKEKLKKCEASWKAMQSSLLRQFAGYIDGSQFINQVAPAWTKSPPHVSECPPYKIRSFNLIRFQVQLAITSPSLVRDCAQQIQEKTKQFVEKIYESIATSLTKYLTIERYEQEHTSKLPTVNNDFLLESFDPIDSQPSSAIPLAGKDAEKFIENYYSSLSEVTQQQLQEEKLEFYWTDLGGLSPNLISKSKSRKIEPSARQVSMKAILSTHYSKRSHKEFLDFCDTFGTYYERYFSETEFGANPMEVISNFGKLVYLLMKAFSLPGRTGSDDVKTGFNQFFTNLRLPQILPWIIRSLRILIRQESDLVNTESLMLARQIFSDPSKNAEYRILGLNLLRLIQFILFYLDGECTHLTELFKVTYFLHHAIWKSSDSYPDERMFKLHRLIHLLLHKNNSFCCTKVHNLGFDTELKLFVIQMQLNLLEQKIDGSQDKQDRRKQSRSLMVDELVAEDQKLSAFNKDGLRSASDQRAEDVERELVQMLRCFYCKLRLLS